MKIKLENKTFFSQQKALFYCSLELEIEEWLFFFENVTMQLYKNPDVDLQH